MSTKSQFRRGRPTRPVGRRALRTGFALSALWAAAALPATTADSQPFRYMDEAGNIFWAERAADVPVRYRNQLVPPTKVPSFAGSRDPRYQAQLRAYKDAERARKAEERKDLDEKKKAERRPPPRQPAREPRPER